MKKKKKPKKILIIIIVLLVLIAAGSIFLGFYFAKLTKINHIVGVGIDKIDAKVSNYVKVDRKYNLGDSFAVKTTLDFDLDSEDYLKKSSTDVEYQEKYKTIKNLSNSKNDIVLIQDKKKKKALFEVHSLLNEEKLLDYKFLIDNATEYYYVEDIMKKYINNGTNNYFEILDEENTTIDNIDYLHEAIVKALKNSLKEEYFDKTRVNENINGSSTNVNRVSIRLDDKRMHLIINDVIDNLKQDERANKILTSTFKDFSKYKIKNSQTILGKKESYTLNIYTSKYLNNILKYELIHLDGDEKKTYTYEGTLEKGNLYYSEDSTIIYKMNITDNNKIFECKIYDSKDKEIGELKVEKNDNSIYYSFNFDDTKKKYDIIYSSKYSNFKENNSFNNEKKISFKYIKNKVSILSGTVTMNSEVNKQTKIEEELSDVVLKSTLTEEETNKYETRKDKLKERLKK